MIPTRFPPESTTGAPLMPRSASSLARAWIVVSGSTVITSLVITSIARIATSHLRLTRQLCSRRRAQFRIDLVDCAAARLHRDEREGDRAEHVPRSEIGESGDQGIECRLRFDVVGRA